MARENVEKFYEKLAADKALAEKLAEAGKAHGFEGMDEADDFLKPSVLAELRQII